MLKIHLFICNAVVLSGCVIGGSGKDTSGSGKDTSDTDGLGGPILPEEGVWSASYTEVQDTCDAFSSTLLTAEIALVTSTGFKILNCYESSDSIGPPDLCPDPNRNVLLDGLDCTLDNGTFIGSSSYAIEVDPYGTTLHYTEVLSGSFDSAVSGAFEQATNVECEKSPQTNLTHPQTGETIDDTCAYYWPDANWPCRYSDTNTIEY